MEESLLLLYDLILIDLNSLNDLNACGSWKNGWIYRESLS